MSQEIIRPTGAYNPGGWSNPSYAYDADSSTASTKSTPALNTDISFGGSSGGDSTNAWAAKAQSWVSATLLINFKKTAAVDDTIGIYVYNKSTGLKHTILGLTSAAVTQQTFSQALTAADWGGAGFPNIDDLRIRISGVPMFLYDNAISYVYDIRIEGNYSATIEASISLNAGATAAINGNTVMDGGLSFGIGATTLDEGRAPYSDEKGFQNLAAIDVESRIAEQGATSIAAGADWQVSGNDNYRETVTAEAGASIALVGGDNFADAPVIGSAGNALTLLPGMDRIGDRTDAIGTTLAFSATVDAALTVAEARDMAKLEPVYLFDISLRNIGPVLHLSTRPCTIKGQTYDALILSASGISEQISRSDSTFLNPDISITFNNDRYAALSYLANYEAAYPFTGALITIKQIYKKGSDYSVPEIVYKGELQQPESITKAAFTCRVQNLLQQKDRNWLNDKVNLIDFPNAWEDIGKTIPIIYGNGVRIPALRTDWGARTTLKTAVTVSATSMELSDLIQINRLPSSGYVYVDDECIYYGFKSSYTLYNLVRGQFSTPATPHSAGATVWEYQAQYQSVLCRHALSSVGDIFAEVGGQLLRVTSGVTASVVGNRHMLIADRQIRVEDIKDNIAVVDTIGVADTITVNDTIAVNDGIAVQDTINVADGIGVSDAIAVADTINVSNPTHLHNYTASQEQFASSLPAKITNTGSGTIYYPGTAGKLMPQNHSISFRVWWTGGSQLPPTGYTGYVTIAGQVVYRWENNAESIDLPSPLQLSKNDTNDYLSVSVFNNYSPPTGYSQLNLEISGATRTFQQSLPATATAQATAKTGAASKSGSVSKTGYVSKSGAATKSGTASKSGAAVKAGSAAKSGAVVKTGSVISTTAVNRFHAVCNNSVESAGGVIYHFLNTWLGYSSNEFNVPSFDTAATAFGSTYKFGCALYDLTPSDIIKQLAFESRSTLKWKADRWYLDYIPDAAPASSVTISEAELHEPADEFEFNYTHIADIVNDITAVFGYDHSAMGNDSTWTGTVQASDSASISKYGKAVRKIEFKLISSQAAAQGVVNNMLLQGKRTFLMSTFGLTWEHFNLKIGDTITLGSLIFPGLKFYIESVDRAESTITVTAREWW